MAQYDVAIDRPQLDGERRLPEHVLGVPLTRAARGHSAPGAHGRTHTNGSLSRFSGCAVQASSGVGGRGSDCPDAWHSGRRLDVAAWRRCSRRDVGSAPHCRGRDPRALPLPAVGSPHAPAPNGDAGMRGTVGGVGRVDVQRGLRRSTWRRGVVISVCGRPGDGATATSSCISSSSGNS